MPGSPPPPAAATGCWKTAGWTCTARARPARRCTWCTPRQTPKGRLKPAPANSSRPLRSWTGWGGPAATRFPPTTVAVAARAGTIAAKRRVGTYLRSVITCDATGKPALSWHFDQAAIDAEAATDGWYALTANLPPAQASPAEVFLRYKGQHVVERRYGEFKGPLAVTPLFPKPSRRIAALITVICLALLIFCLIERQVRKALASHGGKMTGLPGYRLTPAAPTGRTIFMALSDLRLIPAHDGNPAMIPKPAGVQAQLLDLLEIDISRPRWLTK